MPAAKSRSIELSCAHNVISRSFESVSAQDWMVIVIVRDSMNSEMTSGTMSRVVKMKNYYSFLAGHRIVYKFSKSAIFRAEDYVSPLGGLARYALKRGVVA